jgi:hypothetical protein
MLRGLKEREEENTTTSNGKKQQLEILWTQII